MSEWPRRLRRALEAACEEDPLDPDSVAAALGLIYANDLLERPPPQVALADRLRERGMACRSRLAQELLDTGDPEGEVGLLVSVARAGLHVLEGGPEAEVMAFAEAFTPDPGRVVDLLACRLDGVSAARAAAALSLDRPALERARTLARVMDESLDELLDLAADDAREGGQRLRVAAGDVLPLRDPAGGRVVGRTLDPAIEAVLFVDREGSHLALYAAAPVALRLEAEGAMTEDMQPGYWLGRLADGTRSLEAKVYCGDRELSFSVTLSD